MGLPRDPRHTAASWAPSGRAWQRLRRTRHQTWVVSPSPTVTGVILPESGGADHGSVGVGFPGFTAGIPDLLLLFGAEQL